MTQLEKQKLYNEAKAFYELAECGRKYIPEEKDVATHIPYIINMSFCAELLLKLILMEDGKTVQYVSNKRHNLIALYRALSQDRKDAIRAFFLRPACPGGMNRPMLYDIELELTRAKDAFVQWRYFLLDRVGEDPPIEERIPFSEWIHAKENGEAMAKAHADVRQQTGRMQFAPFFFKEFNESLFEICKKI